MTKINYKSDFDFIAVITAIGASGEAEEVGFPSYDWELIIKTNCVSSRPFFASHINGVCNNCFNDNGQIHVVCNDHQLSIGKLICEFRAHLPNEKYADGVQTIISKHQLNIELVSGNGDNGTALFSQLQLPFVVLGDGGINTSLFLTKVDAANMYQPKGDYATTSQLNEKQDKLTSGDGIKIENNIITCALDTSLYKVVVSLPEKGEENKIYLVESNEREEQNIYTEYGYINGKWEALGQYRAEVNLSPYLTKEDAESTYQPKGDYALRSELPTIPTKVSELENDTNYISSTDGMLEIPLETTSTYLTESNNFTANVGLISYADITFIASLNPTGEGIISTIYNGDVKLAEYIAESNQTILYHVRTDKIQVYKVVYGSLESLGDIECNTPIDLKITSSLTNFDVSNGPSIVRVANAKGIKNTKESIALLNEKVSTKADKTEIADMATKTEITNKSYLSKFDYVLFDTSLLQSEDITFSQGEPYEISFSKDEFIFNFEQFSGEAPKISLYHWHTEMDDWNLVTDNVYSKLEVYREQVHGTDYQYFINPYYSDTNKWKIVFSSYYSTGEIGGKYEIVSINSIFRLEAALDYLNKNKAGKNDSETYILNFNVADGINTGSYSEDDYNALRAAIEAGKLIIVAGTVTRVTADSQAMAADYVVVRYSTPRISADNSSVTISVYELKFGLINSGDTEYSYSSKAIHKSLT